MENSRSVLLKNIREWSTYTWNNIKWQKTEAITPGQNDLRVKKTAIQQSAGKRTDNKDLSNYEQKEQEAIEKIREAQANRA